MSSPTVVRTLAGRCEAEIPKIKGSRFFGFAVPAATEEAAQGALREARETWPDATHHCWGWRGLDGTGKASDDGEPFGTASIPIHRRLEGAELHGVMLVVVRYYGGTKLGTGGLVRAYGETANAILNAATVVEQVLTTPVRVSHGYGDSGAVQGVLHAYGLEAREPVYGADVHFLLDVPVDQVEDLCREIRDRSAGRAEAAPDEP